MALSALRLQAHDPAWASQAEQALRAVQEALAPLSPQGAHIGSTAVPGLCAKPVIDLMLGVDSLDLLRDQVASLQPLGWRYRPEHERLIPLRRYFTREAEPGSGLPRLHLHGLLRGGRLWTQHLAVRDALRNGPALRERYAALKRALAAQHPNDKPAYQAGKDGFMRVLLAELDAQEGPHSCRSQGSPSPSPSMATVGQWRRK